MAEWMAYDTQSGEQVEIATAEMKAYIRAIPENKTPFIHFWKTGWADWRPLTQIPEFLKLREATTAAPPPPPKTKTAAPPPKPKLAVVKESFNAGDEPTLIEIQVVSKKKPTKATPAKSSKSERRTSERFAVKLKVLITVDNLVFRTFTIDASREGVKLEHPLPDALVGNQVELYFSSPNTKSGLKFVATLVADQRQMTRFQFVDPNPQTQKVFETWLKSLPFAKVA